MLGQGDYVVGLALAMLDGTFINDRFENDVDDWSSDTPPSIGQHRWMAYKLLGLNPKNESKRVKIANPK